MKIGIDARLYQETGVGRYIKNLIFYLGKFDTQTSYYIFTGKNNIDKIPPYPNYTVVKTDIRWHSFREQLILPPVLEKYVLDLVHFPYFSIPVLYRHKFIITLHDLTILNFSTGRASTKFYPYYLLKNLGYRLILNSAINRSQKIIVPTKTVKEELLSKFRIDKGKIVVTYEGGMKVKFRNDKINYEPFILYVGNVYPHKNLENALRAFRLFKEESSLPVKFVIAGKPDFFMKRISLLIEKLGLAKEVIFTGYLRDEQLSRFYQRALCLIFPSISEGFGLPALEAMQHGCLIACSDLPVFREVCGELPFYFDPKKIASIASAFKKVMALNIKEKEQIVSQETARAQNFSWETMTKKTIALYKEVLK